jgi:hypothetical protein
MKKRRFVVAVSIVIVLMSVFVLSGFDSGKFSMKNTIVGRVIEEIIEEVSEEAPAEEAAEDLVEEVSEEAPAEEVVPEAEAQEAAGDPIDEDSASGDIVLELEWGDETNETEIVSEAIENETSIETNETTVDDNETITGTNETSIETNETTESNVSINILSKRARIIIGRPVKNIKIITVNASEVEGKNIELNIPKDAENISVRTDAEIQESVDDIDNYEEMIDDADREDILEGVITGFVSRDIESGRGLFSRFWRWLTGFTVTGNVISEHDLVAQINETEDSKIIDIDEILGNENENEIAIEYYTDAPISNETEIDGGKRIIISAADELEYEEILAYTELSNFSGITDPEIINLYWYNDVTGLKEERVFDAYDLNEDGEIDYIEWIVPHLSAQVYDLVINTTTATLSGVEFSGNYSRLAINSAVAPYDSLVLYYSFDADEENDLDFTSHDFSSNENDGAATGNVVVNDTNCRYGQCFQGDGIDGNILIGDPADGSLDLIGVNVTLALWYTRPTTTWKTLLDKFIYNLAIDGAWRVQCAFSNDGGAPSDAPIPAEKRDSEWHFLVCTLNSTDQAIYLDGVLIDSQADPGYLSGTTQVLRIGSTYNGGRDWNGSIDEVMIFNTSLTEAQILAIYQNTSSRFVSSGSVDVEQFNISSSVDTVNVSTAIQNNSGTNIGLGMGYYTDSWNTVNEQNITSNENYTYIIDSSSTNLTLNYTLYSDSNNFYTPLLGSYDYGVSAATSQSDVTGPTIAITTPVNGSNYNVVEVEFNITMNEIASWCGFSLDGAVNTTMTLNGSSTLANFTNSSMTEASHNVTFYCNDSVGNMGVSDTHFFLVDATNPSSEFIGATPETSSIAVDNFFVNLSSTDSETDHYSFVDFDNSLVGWWRMDDVLGTAAYDNSSYGNDGTLVGGASQTNSGRFGMGLEFDGDNDRIDLPSDFRVPLNGTNVSFTFSLWINPANWTHETYPTLFGSRSLENGPDYGLAVTRAGDNLKFEITNFVERSLQQYVPRSNWGENQWSHFVWSWNGTTDIGASRAYSNGVLVASGTPTSTGLSWGITTFHIGDAGRNNFNGTIDEFIVFNRSLNDSEIQALYNATASQYYNNFTDLTDGVGYSITGYSVDMGGNVNETTTRTISINLDSTAPTITLVSPANNSGDVDGNLTFIYNVSDAGSSISNCSLIFDSAINETNTTIAEDANQSFNLTGLSLGSHNWSINCTDSNGNRGASEERVLGVVNLSDSFSGETTDLSAVNISNVTDFTLEKTDYGKIVFSENVDLSAGVDLDSYANISDNFIDINSTALSALNVSARLSLYNLSYTNPRVLRNGEVCPATTCTEVDYDSVTGTFIFDITSFTNYSAGETPVVTTTTATSSGGGGGSSVRNYEKVVEELSIDIIEINLDIVYGHQKERLVEVRNGGDTSTTVSMGTIGLDEIVSFGENNFELSPGESRNVAITFTSPEVGGIYVGKILMGGNEISVSINSRSRELLFDAMVVVPDEDKVIRQGEKLDAQITLIPMGERPRLDVTLNYAVKDFNGKEYVRESETILVTGQKSFKKEFYTSDLITGKYVLTLELIYPNGVATSSSHFEVSNQITPNFRILLAVLSSIILVLSVLILWFMIRYKNKKKLLHLRRGRKK